MIRQGELPITDADTHLAAREALGGDHLLPQRGDCQSLWDDYAASERARWGPRVKGQLVEGG